MARSLELVRLQEEFAAATSELTAALNEEFLALVSSNYDHEHFGVGIAEAHERRKSTMQALLAHIQIHGW